MEGTWSAQVLEAGGKTLSAKESEAYRLTMIVKGAGYRIFFEDHALAAGTLRIDPTRKPKAIDAILNNGPPSSEMRVHSGIYQFQGNDLLLIFAEPGRPRPTQFKTRPGTQEMMILYKRVAK